MDVKVDFKVAITRIAENDRTKSKTEVTYTLSQAVQAFGEAEVRRILDQQLARLAHGR